MVMTTAGAAVAGAGQSALFPNARCARSRSGGRRVGRVASCSSPSRISTRWRSSIAGVMGGGLVPVVAVVDRNGLKIDRQLRPACPARFAEAGPRQPQSPGPVSAECRDAGAGRAAARREKDLVPGRRTRVAWSCRAVRQIAGHLAHRRAWAAWCHWAGCRGGRLPGAGGLVRGRFGFRLPGLAQPWARGWPSGSVTVMHHFVAGCPAARAARSRARAASMGPNPVASPGWSARPSRVARGMVRLIFAAGRIGAAGAAGRPVPAGLSGAALSRGPSRRAPGHPARGRRARGVVAGAAWRGRRARGRRAQDRCHRCLSCQLALAVL